MTNNLIFDESHFEGDLSGIQIIAPGFRGSASEKIPASTYRSGTGDIGLLAALQQCGVTTAKQFQIDLEKPADTDDENVTLRIPATDDSNLQCILAEDAAGGCSWHFPSTSTDTTRSIAAFHEYQIPCRREEVSTEQSRAILGWVNRLLMKVLVFPVTDPFIGKAGEFLAAKWEANKRPYQIRRMTPDCYFQVDGPIVDANDWAELSAGPALLFVHGTFSTAHACFGGMPRETFTDLFDAYQGRVFAFNHFTMSHSPTQNVDWFVDQIPAATKLNLDIVSHSRGGLVSRLLSDTLHQRGSRVRRIVFAGAPNSGTPLADPDHTTDLLNRYTSITRLLPPSLAAEGLEGILMLVKAVAHGALKELPGLSAMLPDGEYLKKLNSANDGSPDTQFYAIAADFEPDASRKEFGSFAKRVSNKVVDAVFHEQPHDLVVPYRSVYEFNGHPKFPIAEDRILRYGPENRIHHCSILPSVLTGNQLSSWFREDVISSPEINNNGENLEALVVGNCGYSSRRLKNPTNDAAAISTMLEGLGYNVVCVTDCSRRELAKAVLDFSERLNEAAVGVFFFAGHGVQYEGIDYLLPIDANMQLDRHIQVDGLAVSHVLQQMETARGANNLIILDCCRDNPYQTTTRSAGSRGLAGIARTPPNMLISYATAANHVAQDGKGKNSPFTEALLEFLPRSDAEVFQCLTKVNAAVAQRTNGSQTPWISTNLHREFYLVPPEDSQHGGSEPQTNIESPKAESTPKRPVIESRPAVCTKPFCRMPSDYVNRIIDRLADESEVWIFEKYFVESKEKVSKWIRAGCIDRAVQWREGIPMVSVLPHALTDAGFADDLTEYLQEGRNVEKDFDAVGQSLSKLEKAYGLWFLDGDREKAIEFAADWLRHTNQNGYCHHDDVAHWLLCYLGESKLSRQLLQGKEDRVQMDISSNVVDLATAWSRFHRSDDVAKSILSANEEWWVGSSIVAAAWIDLFDDKDQAEKCVDLIKKGATSADLASIAAVTWLALLDDRDTAVSVVRSAYDRHQPDCEQLELIVGWRSLMDNDLDSEALRILRRAESKAETIDEHASCGATWFNIMGNKSSAERCLKKAAKLVAAVDDWVMIAAYWADFDMRERAVHAVTSAKMDASTSQDFITCADAYLSSCQDRAAAADCLSVAQQRTSHPHELASIASIWARAENVDEAKKAVQAAEERIQKQDDVDVWLSIAEAWSAIGEFPRVKLALDNARHRATTAEDRETVAFMESELIIRS